MDFSQSRRINNKAAYWLYQVAIKRKIILIAVIEKIYMKQITRNRKKYKKSSFLKGIYKMKQISEYEQYFCSH